jgi:hypothetical protein
MNIVDFIYSPSACHNGLGEVAAFLRLFAKTVTIERQELRISRHQLGFSCVP